MAPEWAVLASKPIRTSADREDRARWTPLASRRNEEEDGDMANDEIANDVTGTGGPGGTARDGERDAAEVGRLLDRLGAVEDILTVRKVFGEAYEVDGTTLVPVASVQGGGGGGIGEGTSPDGDGAGSGGGLGFGVRVRPLGVYSVRDGVVTWVPAFDVMRLVTGAQLVLVVALLVFGRRRRRRRS